MVFGVKPECRRCKATNSSIWQRDEKEEVLCSECVSASQRPPRPQRDAQHQQQQKNKEQSEQQHNADNDEHKDVDSNGNGGKEDDQEGDRDKDSVKILEKRDHTNKKKTRKGRQGGKGGIPKGKGRRYIFKKSATKAPAAVATPVTSNYLFYKGIYFQVGDIVSLIDVDGGTYYAQIRGLLQDQYCEKSAVITWLIPTKGSPPPHQGFDPSTYIIGPEEDIPRKLEYMEFECHAPCDYFKDRTSPYSTMTYQPQSCFVWSRLGPQIKPIEKAKELMTK